MESLPTVPLQRIVELQDVPYCDRVASYENLRLTSKALARSLPPLSATDPMVSTCKLIETIRAATREFASRLRTISRPPGPRAGLAEYLARTREYEALRPSAAEYDALMAKVRRRVATADPTAPELAELLRYDDDLLHFRLRMFLHSKGLQLAQTFDHYQEDPDNVSYLVLNPATRLLQSHLRDTWSDMNETVRLSLKLTEENVIQAPEMSLSYDLPWIPTVATTRQFWETAGVGAEHLETVAHDKQWNSPTTEAVMRARDALVLLQTLPPGYAVAIAGDHEWNVICATGLSAIA